MKQKNADISIEAILANEERLQRVLDGSEQGYWDSGREHTLFINQPKNN